MCVLCVLLEQTKAPSDEDEDDIQIIIKKPDGTTFTLAVNRYDSIHFAKRLIHAKRGHSSQSAAVDLQHHRHGVGRRTHVDGLQRRGWQRVELGAWLGVYCDYGLWIEDCGLWIADFGLRFAI